ncbi:MAG: hypothetical protein K2I96_15890 [Lachnospiraceae bacterium]|nr:hypothetical protein [Lachnospiraceae bacterium]
METGKIGMRSVKEKIRRIRILKIIYFKYIYNFLVFLGIRERIDTNRLIHDRDDVVENCQYEIESSLKCMRDCVQHGEDNILIAGEIIKNRGLGIFSNRLKEQIDRAAFYYLAESEIRDEIDFPVFVVPQMFHRNTYKKEKKLQLNKKIKKVINSKEYLKCAVDNTKGRYSDMAEGYAENFVYYSYIYLKKVLDIIKPKVVVLWLEFYAFHEIFLNICKERNIKVYFFEFGVLPGTYTFETMGQMGESIPAINHVEFLNLEVDMDDIIHAQNVLEYLCKNKVTRWKQPVNEVNEINALKKKLIAGRPIILFAGQNDYESGIRPYGEFARKYHSPVFDSSDKAAVYLAKLAEKNNWNIIYKPHPAVINFAFQKREYDIPDNVIMVDQLDINDLIDMADVLVTIVSQMGYMSLIRGKATVMLGYTQLRGKLCTYEAFTQSVIDETINDALKYGMTEEQRTYFVQHIAQIIKYYVYDDEGQREIRYGREMKQCKDFLKMDFK